MQEKTDQAAQQKVLELIKDIDYALLGTRTEGGGPMHARPMACRAAEFDGDIWFFTKADSRKVRELKADPETLLCFADSKGQNYVSMTGHAAIVSDRTKVKELWTEIYRAWFPNGPEDPNIVLLKVSVDHAEYWDTPSSLMVHAYGYLKAVTTGKPAKPGDVGTVDYD
ncbi:pyridoxamine 5'-phosphate oxidase family protein [Lichenihabitans sp. PAMC28606]|uniref:pyridoxamine 5'-phosphate oxidase family protein n=1 Tax=Lichenihabitans sp. PAMC28606 TaxID=2880932 RepID=UPI001D09CE79|nr:pyridoxamine 5'-phosphate oxidase family protein [Lichenihabitans sp. PAMC28606]UDL93247.1 pyridoxamine 5'-phosphate oxidase family protein [Lichenihabitans sp. PAMC28606]